MVLYYMMMLNYCAMLNLMGSGGGIDPWYKYGGGVVDVKEIL